LAVVSIPQVAFAHNYHSILSPHRRVWALLEATGLLGINDRQSFMGADKARMTCIDEVHHGCCDKRVIGRLESVLRASTRSYNVVVILVGSAEAAGIVAGYVASAGIISSP